jgi:hypothetical protein
MPIFSMRIGHTRSDIPGFDKSFAQVSETTGKIERAVIFIHGFSGSANGTWTDFLTLVDDPYTDQWWEESDLFFFDYHSASLHRKLARNKLDVLKFINHVWPNPPDSLFTAGGVTLRKDVTYSELFLVGHSEGGLLLRKVILDVADSDAAIQQYRTQRFAPKGPEPSSTGVLIANLRLFAPALGGETINGLLGVLSRSPVISTFTGSLAAKLSMGPASAAVTSARDSTNEYSDYLKMECFRAHILWADDDTIIEPERYKRDLECGNPPPGTSHTSVCKPTQQYKKPLKFVKEGVVNGKC